MNTSRHDFSTLIDNATTERAKAGLQANNFEVLLVETGKEALELIKTLIPKDASLMNGSSRTLEEIGFVEYLKSGTHGWNNLHEAVLKETDKAKQSELRKHSVVSDYYLGSAHAVTEDGHLVFASNSGSQLPHLAFTSPNIILVVGRHKIVPTLSDALTRIDEYIVPLEDVNIRQKYGVGTMHAKTLILHKENPAMGRTIKVILVNEKLGF